MKTSCCVSGFAPVHMAGGILLSALFVIAGCEVEPVQDFAVSISPDRVDIRQDQSQKFIASGGVRYEWQLSSTGSDTNADTSDPWGILSASTGNEVTYTSLRSPADGEYYVRTLTVTATLGSQNVSNTTLRTTSATAYIYHIP